MVKNSSVSKKSPSSYVIFNEDLCIGCAECMKVCPTRAIRIRDERSVRLLDQCIGCGECLRVCPAGAISTDQPELEPLDKNKFSAVVVSPVLFSQFPGEMPSDILAGLKKMGYTHIVELSDFLEMFQFATVTFIQENRKNRETPWPLLSPVCPVVVSLIAIRFPGLLKHIIPIERPLVLLISDIKNKISRQFGIKKENIILHHITPCPSKAVLERSLSKHERLNIDMAFGINSVYSELFHKIEEVKKADILSFSRDRFDSFTSGRCLKWGMSGGEISGMRIDKSMAVSGIKETIDYLEKIELGMFRNMEYIEFRACPEGCLGGPLTVIDKYLAKSGIYRRVKMFGMGRRLPRYKIRKLYDEGWFFPKTGPIEDQTLNILRKKPLSIEALHEIDLIFEKIRGKNCAVCGSPDCRTFAEDVVRGDAKLSQCIVLRARNKAGDEKKKKRKGKVKK